MKYNGKISIENKSTDEAVIDIEGVIGVPEWWQFDNAQDKIATYDKFKSKVNEIKNLSAKNITVNIRSLGGNVNDAFLIHDTLTGLSAVVTTVSYGYTASAATIIHQAGRFRKISSLSLYLTHQASTRVSGNLNDLADSIQMLQKTNDRIVELYSGRGGHSKEYYTELMNRANGNGEWLSPDEVIEAKLADEIINTVSASNIDKSLISNYKLPDIPENKIINQESGTNLNNKKMKIKIQNGWNFIQKLFNWKTDDEIEVTTETLNTLNNRCTELETENVSKENEILNLKNDSAKKDTKISNLENKVSNLESELAKAKADPTKTKDKEDPAIDDEGKKTGNAAAYDEDVKCFKD